MLLERIRKDPVLSKYLSEDCEEEGVRAVFDDKVAKDSYVIIKVDDYYNDEGLRNTPPSPDCLIIQECAEAETYAATIVELKSIKNNRGFAVKNMTEKFETCLSNFMSRRFKHYFDRDFTRIKLLFISSIDNHKINAGSRMEALIEKRFTFRDKRLLIDPRVSTIKPCY